MSLVGIFSKSRPSIHDFVFDALLEESSEQITDVTEYPIETGEAGNDHAVQRPLRLTMTVALSDNPIKALQAKAEAAAGGGALGTLAGSAVGIGSSVGAGVVAGALGGAGSAISGVVGSIGGGIAGMFSTADVRSEVMLQDIRALQSMGALIDVVGAKGSYKDVMITNTRTQVTKQNEGGLELVVEMRKLIIVDLEHSPLTKTENLPQNDTAATQAQPEVNLGEAALQ